jgi:hypothetical protein
MPVSPGHIVHHRRRSAHRKGHIVSKATRAKISASLRKRGHLVAVSAATRQKISAGVRAANARKKNP